MDDYHDDFVLAALRLTRKLFAAPMTDEQERQIEDAGRAKYGGRRV